MTRVLVTRHPTSHPDPNEQDHPTGKAPHPSHRPNTDPSHRPNTDPSHRPNTGPGADQPLATPHPSAGEPPGAGLGGRLRAALALLPPILGGAPTQPLEVGRTTRVIQAAQRSALAVRDGGCVFPDCTRSLAWCEAHHLRHWLHGGPTNLANLALVCRAHHRAVHEGGWRLVRQADGRLTATPPHRRHRTAA